MQDGRAPAAAVGNSPGPILARAGRRRGGAALATAAVLLVATLAAAALTVGAPAAPAAPGKLRNATAVLVKPRGGGRELGRLVRRWQALKRQPWVDDVDHVVFVEVARADKAWVDRVVATMEGRAMVIDVSAEFSPREATAVAAKRGSVGGIDCPANPTSNYFSLSYKAMCRFWYARAWRHLASYAYVLRVDDDCEIATSSWPRHPRGRVTPVVWQGMDARVVTTGVTKLFGIEQHADSAVWDTKKRRPYTNVMLADVQWARGADATRWFDRVEATGCVFRNRWGDLPLWGATVAALGLPRYNLAGWKYTHGTHRRTCSCGTAGPAERNSEACVIEIGELAPESPLPSSGAAAATAVVKKASKKPKPPPARADAVTSAQRGRKRVSGSASARDSATDGDGEGSNGTLIALNVAYCRPSLFERALARAFPGRRRVRVVHADDADAGRAEVAIVGHRIKYDREPRWQLAARRALKSKSVRWVITVSGENEFAKGDVDPGFYKNLAASTARTPLVRVRTTVHRPAEDKRRVLYVPWGLQQADHARLLKRPPAGAQSDRPHLLAYLNRDCRAHRDRLFRLLRPHGAVQLGTCGGDGGRHPHIPGRVSRAYAKARFGVAMENSFAPGYLTEKMGMVFEGGAVPVFWGDSAAAAAVFNPDAYVDAGAQPSAEAAAALIRAIAANATRYDAMQSAPVLAGGGAAPPPCFDEEAVASCVGDAIRLALDPSAGVTPTGCCVDPPGPARAPRWR